MRRRGDRAWSVYGAQPISSSPGARSDFPFPFPPAAVVVFLLYHGLVYKAFGSLDVADQAALAEELTAHWSAHNTATNGDTRLTSEYLEVLATKGA